MRIEGEEKSESERGKGGKGGSGRRERERPKNAIRKFSGDIFASNYNQFEIGKIRFHFHHLI
jgi:hypothetical protein